MAQHGTALYFAEMLSNYLLALLPYILLILSSMDAILAFFTLTKISCSLKDVRINKSQQGMYDALKKFDFSQV